MEADAASGAEHLLRAARDARFPDAEIERRVARKNAVVAHALQARRLSLPAAEYLLYHPDLRDGLLRFRPGCAVAHTILKTGCALTSLEDRLLKWSPDLERALDERLALLLLVGQQALAKDALVETLRGRSTLTLDEVALASSLADAGLLPALLRTLTADLAAWATRERQSLRSETLGALVASSRSHGWPAGPPRASDDAPPALPDDGEAEIARWRRWWAAEGCRAYPEPRDALPDPPLAPAPPVALLPEGGGEYTLDPPTPFFYLGRQAGHPEIVAARPRRAEPATWRARLARAAAAVLDDGEPSAPEYEGLCALDGHHVHPSRRGEGLLLSIPDPEAPIAWLSCTECGQAGYVRYALRADALHAP